MARKIRVTVEFPFAGVSSIEEYYDLPEPENWDSFSEEEKENILSEYGREELENSGVDYGASVVEVED